MEPKREEPLVGVGRNSMVAGDVSIQTTHVHAESSHKCDSCGRFSKENMFECPDCHRTVCEAHYRIKPKLCDRCSDNRFRENVETLKAGFEPHLADSHALRKEIQRSAELFQSSRELLETELQKTKHVLPNLDRSGLSARLKLAEARWTAGRREEAVAQLEKICRDFRGEDEALLLYARFRGSSDPTGALEFIRTSDWASPARFLAEYALESKADGVDHLLDQASFLFPDSQEVAIMRAAEELLNALDLRDSGRLQKAEELIRNLAGENWLPQRKALESVITWVTDTSQPVPSLEPAGLLVPKLQKVINQVKRSGIKSLHQPFKSFLGTQETSFSVQPIMPEPADPHETVDISADTLPSNEASVFPDGKLLTYYSAEETKPLIRFGPKLEIPPAPPPLPSVIGQTEEPPDLHRQTDPTPSPAPKKKTGIFLAGAIAVMTLLGFCYFLMAHFHKDSKVVDRAVTTATQDSPKVNSSDPTRSIQLHSNTAEQDLPLRPEISTQKNPVPSEISSTTKKEPHPATVILGTSPVIETRTEKSGSEESSAENSATESAVAVPTPIPANESGKGEVNPEAKPENSQIEGAESQGTASP
jgi:hypothetical protein